MTSAWRIAPLGDRALIVEFGQVVDAAVNARVRAAARAVTQAVWPEVTDVVPAFASLALHFQPAAGGRSPYESLCARVDALLAQVEPDAEDGAARAVEVPVCYGGEFGPDLDEVARACGLDADEVVARHVASPHVAFMLGFAPGLPYLGGLDEKLAVPRRASPRTAVPAGSVAIAREQSIIYPLRTPGGWNLIGRTPLRLFDPAAWPPCRILPGDRVRFVSIAPAEFAAQEASA
jgi:inhibitor of KinA